MRILITGGASGLGKAITTKLAGNSENIIYVTYHHSRVEALELEAAFPNVKSIHLDFTSSESIDQFVSQLPGLQPEVLINNALTGFTQNYFHKFNLESVESSFRLNVMPVLAITKKFIGERRKYKSGKIITILTSALINRPPIGWSEYVANKSYLQAMAKSWAVENASYGITSNCISPSFMMTHLTKEIDERLIENMVDGNPNKALLKESEVAETVAFLITVSAQVNGVNLVINAAQDIV